MLKQFEDLMKQVRKESLIAQTNEQLHLMALLLNKCKGLEGDIAEVGVFKGGTARFMSELTNGEKIVHLFDTYEGMPPVRKNDYIGGGPEGLINRRNLFEGEMVGTFEEVSKLMEGFPKTIFYKGRFPDTVNEVVKDAKYCFVHLDADIYQSTKDGLFFFYDRLVDGGVILIHDYAMCNGVREAIKEFTDYYPEKPYIVENQCYILKENGLINIPIDELAIYPFWNVDTHRYIAPMTYYETEYFGQVFPELLEDIRKNGILEPLLVEKLPSGKYGVADGNHRYYIALLLGLKYIPCRILSPELKAIIQSRQTENLANIKEMFSRFDFKYMKVGGVLIDDRVMKIGKYLTLENKRVLELGPFEGRDTYNLHLMHPKEIVSIEGRLSNYQKANLVKFAYALKENTLIYNDIELMDLPSLGKFDLCLAKGILHHLSDPVKIIQQLSHMTEHLWLGIRLAVDTKDWKDIGQNVVIRGYRGKAFYESNNEFLGLHNKGVLLYKDELMRLLQDVGYDMTDCIEMPSSHTPHNNYFIFYAHKDPMKYWKLRYPC